MKHFIIAKFKENIDWKALLPEITELFDAGRAIDGISDVIVHPSCSSRIRPRSPSATHSCIRFAPSVFSICRAMEEVKGGICS